MAFAGQTCLAAFHPTNLKVNGLHEPLGIDSPTPTFSWQTSSDERHFIQSAYNITVQSPDGTVLWDSGKTMSKSQNQIAYKGKPLRSHTPYKWSVTVYDNTGKASTTTSSTFETAFLPGDEWNAKWVSAPAVANSKVEIVVSGKCRYIRLYATRLGLPASSDPKYNYLQISEIEIYSGGKNIASKALFTANNTWDVDRWSLNYINDGVVSGSTLGYTTERFNSVDQHIQITADLGETLDIDKIIVYPRQDDAAQNGTEAANFPSSYTIQTANKPNRFKTIYRATDGNMPTYTNNTTRVPYIGCNFSIPEGKKVCRARLYASASGVFTMSVNGANVTDNKLEPGESEYEKTLLYSTYDVTSALRTGKNSIIAQVAGGLFNVDILKGRYSKGEIINSGDKAIKAELHITYEDGTSDIVKTDEKWRSAPSPTLGSNWWGGEDYDARLTLEGIDIDYYDVSDWTSVSVVKTPAFASSQGQGFGSLKSRPHEPLRIVEEWKAKEVRGTNINGQRLYIIDFGRNFAGQYRFKLKGAAGQTITLREGESLNPDGTIFMQNYYTGPADTYDIYTFAGNQEGEQWGPSFMYHGFRYIQISGLTEAPSPEDFTALRIRSDVEASGTFECSNELLNGIHTICRDAIQSQLYNAITDCPQREKLGWLDVPNEMYNSLSYNFNMENFYKKVVLDCFDAQTATGKIPSTVPHFMSVYDDDPNWGGAAILVPYRSWKTYGDRSTIRTYYERMKALTDYYTSKTTNGIMPGKSYSVLSDWGQETAGVSPMVPGEFTITTTYYHILKAMTEIASELGRADDAARYSRQAEVTKKAFNERFYVDGVYGSGQQAELAMPLYYGLVEPENEATVAKRLADRVRQDNYKIKTGEIALKPLLMTLAKYGYNDIVYEMANQIDCPSYGYWVKNGYTTTPEYWDVGAFSQNHCMMDHIEEWFFSELGGINNAGFAYDTVRIAPWIPADMQQLKTSFTNIYGMVRCEYKQADDKVEYLIEIPANTVGKVELPCTRKQSISENGRKVKPGQYGVIAKEHNADKVRLTLGSGTYSFNVSKGK